MAKLKLSSPAFETGALIPEKYGYEEENINPPLKMSGIPDSANFLALVMDDPDAVAPAGQVWDHWVIWNIPADVGRLEEGEIPGEATEGKTDYGERGYGGPNPPDREHTYRFRLFALREKIDLGSSAKKDDLLEKIEGKIIEESELEGRYRP